MDGYDGVLYPVPELLPFFLHPNRPMQIRFTPTDAADQRSPHPTPATFPKTFVDSKLHGCRGRRRLPKHLECGGNRGPGRPLPPCWSTERPLIGCERPARN